MFRVDIDFAATLAHPAFAVLAEAERARARSLRRHEDAMRHAATRAALRHVLAERTGVPAAAWRFDNDACGRPRFAPGSPGGSLAALDFNVAHAGSHGLIAIAHARRVGVDVEARDRSFDWRPLAPMVFAPRDADHVRALPESRRCDAFFAAWTAKEALLKALGSGLSAMAARFSVLGDDARPVALPAAPDNAPDAALDALSRFDAAWCPVPAGYAACVAWSRDAAVGDRA